MNKGFLSKKSWHTGSLRHVEKVWKAERAHDEEQKKIEVLKKEMAEEQQIYDLKKLHQEATGKKSDRIDWMYDGNVVAGGGRTTAEEYLLGKKYDGDKDQEDLGKLKTTIGSLFMGVVNPAQDAAQKIRDDPLLAIKREEQKALNDILQNPVIMNDIRKEKEYKELLKRMKKDKKKKDKKDKKKEKKRSMEEGRRDDTEAESPKRRRLEDEREDSRRDERRDRDKERHDRDRDYDRRDKDRDSSERRDRERSDKDKDSSERRDHRDRDRDRDRDSNDRDKEREKDRHDRGDRDDRRDRDRRDRDDRRERDDKRDREDKRERDDKRDREDRRDRDRDRKERDDKEREIKKEDIKKEDVKKEDTKPGYNNKPVWKRDNKRRQPIDEAEKQKRLAEMMQDAQTHEEDRWTRLKREKAEEAEEAKNLHTAERTFIDNLNKNLYDTQAPTIEERMKRNVHYIQRRSVDDKFMKA